jgi:hypothetical protein
MWAKFILDMVAMAVGTGLAGFVVSKLSIDWQKNHEIFLKKYNILYELLEQFGKKDFSPRFVCLLRTIGVIFFEDKNVIQSFKNLMDHNRSYDEKVGQDTRKAKTYIEERDDLFVSIIAEISKSIGIKLTKQDILYYRYSPYGETESAKEEKIIKEFYKDILSGKRSISVIVDSCVQCGKSKNETTLKF